jgi:hypothetical protein
MEREFISLDIFNRLWEDLGLTDNDLKDLQEFLCINPEAGSVIQHTGGVRKLRWSLRDKGKSGGARILYVDFIMHEKIYLLTVYPKSKKENISEKEKKTIKELVTKLKEELRRKS